MFDQEWESKSLYGWESFIPRILGEVQESESALYCQYCKKMFLNDNVFHFHKKGKRHIKAVNSSQPAEPEPKEEEGGAEPQTQRGEFTNNQKLKLMQVARHETWIVRLL